MLAIVAQVMNSLIIFISLWYLVYVECSLFNQLNLPGPPGLIEPSLERAIDSQSNPPAFTGDGLYPVGFLTRRRNRAEKDIHRVIRVDDDSFPLVACAGKLLVRLQQRACLRIVDDHRPEVLRWYVWRQVQPVTLRAIEVLTRGVTLFHGILRADAYHRLGP